jgi:hypothetical protein
MVEIENLELTATSNPAGEATGKTFLASVDSMSLMQGGQAEGGCEETSKGQQRANGLIHQQVQCSQQHDTRGDQPPPDDVSV